MAFSSVLQMYLGWANSMMCERGILIEGLHELQDGAIFCHLIELLTGTDLRAVLNQDSDSDSEDQISLNATVQLVLDYLQGIGVHVKATAASVVCGELKSILDMMWAIILHCTIHAPDLPVGQRTVRNGRKTLLQWCRDQLDQDTVLDVNKTMVKSFSQNNLLSDLISVHCTFANEEADNDDELVTNLTNALLAAEDHLGITKTLLNSADVICGTSDEHALLIYIALLKRKVSSLMSRTSSLSSLSSNENSTFHIPMNCRNEARKTSISSVPESTMSSQSIPVSITSTQSAPDSSISAKSTQEVSSISTRSAAGSSVSERSTSSNLPMKVNATEESVALTQSAPSFSAAGKVAQSHQPPVLDLLHQQQKDKPESGVDTSETQSVSVTVSNWSKISSPSPPTSPIAKQSPNGLQNKRSTSPVWENKSNDSGQKKQASQQSTNKVYSAKYLPQDRQIEQGQSSSNYGSSNSDDYHSVGKQGRMNDRGQRSEHGQVGGGVVSTECRWQKQEKNIMEKLRYERGHIPNAKGDFLPKGEDELLSLLEAISLESSHLRHELKEYQQRESALQNELDESASAAEEHVVSKLVQELEMLRAENQRLFRDSASARTSNAHDKKTVEKLQVTINRLKNDVDKLNSENFRLNLRLKLLESHKVQDGRGGADGEEAERSLQTMKDQEAAAEMYLMDQFLDLPGDTNSEELIQHLSSNQQLLGNFSEVNVQLAAKLSELNDELTKVKVGSRQLDQENRLLRMKAETSKLEADTTGSRCHRLQDHLALAQKKNAKLVQDLQGIVKETSPEGDKTRTFLRMRQLEEENALLKQQLELADEDRQLLRKELEQYKKNQSSIDVMFSNMSSRKEFESAVDTQNIARERVMQSVQGKSEREAGVPSWDSEQSNFKRNDDLDENSNPLKENKKDRFVIQEENNNRLASGTSSHHRKPSLGDLIVAKASHSPPMDGNESGHDTGTEDGNDTETAIYTNLSDMSDTGDNHLINVKNVGYHNGRVASNPSGDAAPQEENGTDDADSQTTEEEPEDHNYTTRHKDQITAHHSEPLGSKSNSVKSTSKYHIMNSLDTRSNLPRSDGVKSTNTTNNQMLAPKLYKERDNPRLARLQQLRSRLGIGKSGQNASLSPATDDGNFGESTTGFEIKSKFGASGSRRRWMKFNSFKEDDNDLGSSYLDSSSKQSFVQESGEAGTTNKKLSLKSSGEESQLPPQFGRVSLDEYVRSLKHRVQTLEHEGEEFDEYIKLPEQIEQPQRLAENSPKQDRAKASPNQSNQPEDVSASQMQTTGKSRKKLYSETKEANQEEPGVSVTLLSSRASADGMSDCHGQLADITTDEDGTIKTPDQSCQTKPIPNKVKSPSNEPTGAKKRTPSPATPMHVVESQDEDMDSVVKTSLSQSDRSISSTGDTDKLHLSGSEDSKSYKHELLKEDEQEYANSIIEKYLDQLTVVPP